MPLLDGGSKSDPPMSIAVVGIGFRGPGDATNVENLWKLIAEGGESRCKIPKERWNHEAFYHSDPNRHGTYNVDAGHFLKQDLSRFDAPFFNMTAAEAAALDPQQRLLLECSYEAMENSGTHLDGFCGSKTSVFVGSFCADYTDILWRDPEKVPMYQCTNSGHSRANMANRISYFYDLKGPSVTVDTACSTSLVALHLGCQSLRTGDARQALVGGSSVILSHEVMVTMSMMRFMSPDGRCYTFDERANGYARGEGVGCILLKPLSDALRDGDTIRAVIRGTGSNQDGKTPGITMPNGVAQEELIRSVYESAGLDPRETSYVEAHGTGTQAGDPIETRALSQVFGPNRSFDDPLRIGSVKTNVGHLEGASGIVAVIKTVLMLENDVFLPNRNFQRANPRIPLKDWKLKVPTSLERWESRDPHRASVNSFGYGGANAHAILESSKSYLSSVGLEGSCRTIKSMLPAELRTHANGHANVGTNGHINGESNGFTNGNNNGVSDTLMEYRANGHANVGTNGHVNGKSNGFTNGTYNGTSDVVMDYHTNGHVNGSAHVEKDDKRTWLFVLSSFDEATGKRQLINLKSYLAERLDKLDDKFMDDLAYTLNERRTKYAWKAAIPARSASMLLDSLEEDVVFKRGAKDPRIGFVFTGQGAQWCGMGKELIAAYPVFRNTLERAAACLKVAGAVFDVVDELTKDPKRSEISLAIYSQPLCTAVQVALVDLLFSWGIKPCSVTGHSSGEIAAAYAMGALTLEDAMIIAYYRGVCSSNLVRKSNVTGSMMAIGMSMEDALPIIAGLTLGKVVVACVNSPSSITVSGDESAIDELQAILDNRVFARKLAVEVAYHSHHMVAVGEQYREAIAGINTIDAGDVEFFSSVTGDRAVSSDLGPAYWVSNMLGQVKFEQAVRQLCLETSASKRSRKRALTSGVDVLIEIGPHSALAGPINQTLQADERLRRASIHYYSALVRKSSAVDSILRMVSNLVTLGYAVELSSINYPMRKESRCVLVDLPPYSWNHESSYWAESRLSKAFRNRRFPRIDCLGALERNSSPLEPRWRNHIRLSELPWIRDHKVQSNIVYPGAGYIVMAIEAAFQRVAQRSVSKIIGYKLREVAIGSALVISENPGEVEVAITLKPFSDSIRSPSDLWDEFVISSVSEDNRWTEHCRGLISVQIPLKVVNVIDGETLEAADKKSYSDMIIEYDAKCRERINVSQFYDGLTSLGLEYGEMFANMSKACLAPSRCIGHIKIPDTAAAMPMRMQFPLVIHPATLDSLFHTIFVALSAEIGPLKDPVVPVSVEEIFISHGITKNPNDELVTYTSTEKKDHRYVAASLTVFGSNQESVNEPVISIRGITCATLAREGTQDVLSEGQRRAYNIKWQADIDLLSQENLVTLCESLPESSSRSSRRNLELAAFHLLKAAVESVPNEVSSAASTYQQELWTFFKSLVDRTTERRIKESSDRGVTANESEVAMLLEKVRASKPEGSLLCHVGEQLPRLLKGEVTPHPLVRELDLGIYFESSNILNDCKSAVRYIELLGHKNPELSIMAVGVGAGLASLPLLAMLGGADCKMPCFAKYEYTDVDYDITNVVQSKCGAWSDLIVHKDFNIEADLVGQEYELESYDVIIAFHVLGSSAREIQTTMANARKLLKPRGKLMLIGVVLKSLVAFTISGFLPSVLKRQLSKEESDIPMTNENWDSVARQAGFSSDAIISNAADRTRPGGVFLTAIPVEKSIVMSKTLIVVGDFDSGVSVPKFQELLSSIQIDSEVVAFENAKPTSDQVCVVLGELGKPILAGPSPSEWDAMKRIFLGSGGVLWVTRGGTVSSPDPTNSLVQGIARTVRSENGEIPIITLDLDSGKPLDESTAAEVIQSVFKCQFCFEGNATGAEYEYAERGGILHIPRLVEDIDLTKLITTSADDPKPELQLFQQSRRPLRMFVRTPGLLDSICFTDDDRITADLPVNWIEIEVKATGFNFKDVMMALGQIKVESLGLECSGVVTATGKDVTNFSIGDRVACYGLGTFCTKYRGPATCTHKIPELVSFETAAAIPVTYATAYYSVYRIAELHKGETVLVHAATGGLGQAIIELCQLIGAEIFATVGTAAKKRFLMDHFKIPEDHIFFSRDGSFARGVKRMTAGKGVDAIMNSLAGESLRLTWDCIAPYGRFVELGARDITINSRLEMGHFIRNASFAAFNLVYLFEQKPDVANKILADVMDLFCSGAIRGPSPIHSYSISEVERALRTMQTGSHMGKLVAVSKPGDMVKVLPQDTSKNLLRPDASYVLVGGLGGIGRATALWMIEHGAKNIIFVNRSGLKSQDAQATVQSLESRGCNVAVIACDVTDSAQVEALVAHVSKELPPIRGVIQGAMILRDTLFEKMTLEDYNIVIRPKVQGTWNLHDLLPKDMDFFLMESSVSGIVGNATQAAYAAGNTFLDSFTAYRNSLGLPATTIDLGAITGVGYLASNNELREAMARQGFEFTNEKLLMKLIQFAIQNPRRDGLRSHIVTGLGSWKEDSSLGSLSLPLFAHFRHLSSSAANGEAGSADSSGKLRKALRKAKTLEDASELVCASLVEKIASRSGIPVEDVNVTKAMPDYGIDSLVAVEMRNWIVREMDSTVPILELLASNPISQLATKIAQRSRLVVLDSGEES